MKRMMFDSFGELGETEKFAVGELSWTVMVVPMELLNPAASNTVRLRVNEPLLLYCLVMLKLVLLDERFPSEDEKEKLIIPWLSVESLVKIVIESFSVMVVEETVNIAVGAWSSKIEFPDPGVPFVFLLCANISERRLYRSNVFPSAASDPSYVIF